MELYSCCNVRLLYSLPVQLFCKGQYSSLHELASEIILQGTVFFNIHVVTLLMYNRSLKIIEPHSIFKIQKI